MKFGKFAAAIAAGAILAACGGQGGVPYSSSPSTTSQAVPFVGNGTSPAEINHWVPRYLVRTSHVSFDASKVHPGVATTIPYFTSSVKSPLDGKTYSYSIVGKDPTKSTGVTKVNYVPIVLIITYPDGTVLDATQPGCNDTVSVADRFFKGPNFAASPLVSNGVKLGSLQLTAAFQRAEFYGSLKSTKYSTKLVPAVAPIIVKVNAPSAAKTVAGVCSGTNHNIGEIDINWYDSEVQSLANQYATTTEVPVVLSYNTMLTSGGGCCIIGYHDVFSHNGNPQFYSVGAYNDAGVFGSTPIEDIHAWTHELGELLNDPFTNNPTPAWGHIGQVGGCQNNLEVGDPLTGTAFVHKYKGFTYHPQELAFFDWFFRTPSQGTGGKYSFEGTFTTSQGACH